MKYDTPLSTTCRERRLRRRVPACAIATIMLALATAAGCSGNAAPATTTVQTATTATTSEPPTSTATTVDTLTSTTSPVDGAPTTVTYSPPYTGTTLAGVPLPPFESNALARELKRTSMAITELAGVLLEAGAPESDPRSGTVFALRARAQALTARRAIVDNQLPLADEAVSQLGRLLAEGTRTAQDGTAAALTLAQEHMALMAFPSEDTRRAASALDYLIRDLAPLVPEETTPTS